MAEEAAPPAEGGKKPLPPGYVNPYSEKAMLGVFSSYGYIDVGTKAAPLKYPVKDSVRSSFTGRQMVVNPGKDGLNGAKGAEVYLDKKFTYLNDKEPYVDRIKYAETQKEKKLGFGTSDFSKRDEFSMDFRTEQYREALKSENRHTAAATAKAYQEMQAAMEAELAAGGGASTAEASPGAGGKKKRPVLFFDRVFDETPAPAGVVSNRAGAFNAEVFGSGESLNPTQISRERNYGRTKTSSMDCGYGIDTAPHGKPQFARMPVLNAAMYRPCAIPITQNTTVYTKRPQ